MKKQILFLFVIVFLLPKVVFSQSMEEGLHKGQYEDQYVLPQCPVADGNILESILNASVGGGLFHCSSFKIKCEDIAQLFHTDTLLTIIGVATPIKTDFLYADKFNYVFGVADTSLTMKRWTTIPDTISAGQIGHYYYVELFFDSAINTLGDYYVVFDSPKPSSFIPDSNGFDISFFSSPFNVISLDLLLYYGSKEEDCIHHDIKKRSVVFNYGGSIVSSDYMWKTVSLYNNRGVYMFPIFAETDSTLQCIGCADEIDTTITDTTITDSSSLVNIVDNYTFIFPNPTSKEVNVQCSFRMQSLELFNEQGQRVNEWKIDSYHYLLNVEDYPKGNYILKIKTKSGTATKKVIVQ